MDREPAVDDLGELAASGAVVTLGELVIDPRAREVRRRGTPIALAPKELDLLLFLAANPRQAFNRDELLRRVWGSAAALQQATTVTEHVRRLRLKLEHDPARPQLIKTVRAAGYRLDPAEQPAADAGQET